MPYKYLKRQIIFHATVNLKWGRLTFKTRRNTLLQVTNIIKGPTNVLVVGHSDVASLCQPPPTSTNGRTQAQAEVSRASEKLRSHPMYT